MNTDYEISQFLLKLSESFPGQVKTGTLEIYMQELKTKLLEVDLKVVHSKLFNECDYFPTGKKILEVVKSRREVERASQAQRNLLAEASVTYTEASEFFKKNGVANFSEYLEKQKRSDNNNPEGA